MTEEEYLQAIDGLLRLHGGSISRPSGGWAKGDTLYFSCVLPPMAVPLPQNLSDAQRKIIVDDLTARLGK